MRLTVRRFGDIAPVNKKGFEISYTQRENEQLNVAGL